MSIAQLEHITRPLQNGGKVVVLNLGAEINPEADAMLQALHSRSTGGIDHHLKVLTRDGPERFMSTYYVGYGHRSIGDCGSCTIFIEGVSMLAAKAIQDWRLYSGQEASTRYIDFASQHFMNPLEITEGQKILERWRKFYIQGLEDMVSVLKERFPVKYGESELRYNKAIKARAFDIVRGFLPAAATTNLAWHTNLRQAADHLALLRHHPLEEVVAIAKAGESAVTEAFPNSFDFDKDRNHTETEEYNHWIMGCEYYFTYPDCPNFCVRRSTVEEQHLALHYRQIMARRPPRTELPHHIAECGDVSFDFLLDFGSFRDIQRHRAVSQRMPLLVPDHGFDEWYLEQLPDKLRNKARILIADQQRATEQLSMSKEVAQYYQPMGYKLPNRVTGDLRALVYLVELRASSVVHPTLSIKAVQMAKALKKMFGQYGLVLHLDPNPGRFNVTRGDHDIVRKE
jgi:thymidylate synthase ThyX